MVANIYNTQEASRIACQIFLRTLGGIVFMCVYLVCVCVVHVYNMHPPLFFPSASGWVVKSIQQAIFISFSQSPATETGGGILFSLYKEHDGGMALNISLTSC